MFYSLPAETVFEAKERTKRATFYLFILLVGLYIFFANLLLVSGSLMLRGMSHSPGPIEIPSLVAIATLGSTLIAVMHFYYVRGRSLDDLLAEIGTKPADPRDNYHSQFINLVSEAEAATGIHGIRPVILPTTGLNAFSLQDGKGNSAIGVTDGLLPKLTRQELSAVVAHEAAHLVHEDSRLVTTACFLFSVFGRVNEILGGLMRGTSNTFDRRSRNRGGSISGVILVLWIISGAGYLVTRLISMSISREREYLADTDGVQMCKDPLALAESLYKISNRYRGGTPVAYSPLFIMNPSDSGLDEQEGFFSNLFSNHPPVSKRLSKLLAWARTDLKTLQELDQKGAREEDQAESGIQSSPGLESPGFMAYQGDKWVGPYSPPQLLSMGFMSPSTWVCPSGGDKVVKASEAPELLPLFQQQVQGAVSQNGCPRCKVPMITSRYEGTEVEQCTFCRGYLLRAGVLDRLITREETTFAAEDIKRAKTWRDSQSGPAMKRDLFPEIKCPHCQNHMTKMIHTMLTQVVIDRCSNESCGAIWCDGGELETIQMIVEDAHKPRG